MPIKETLKVRNTLKDEPSVELPSKSSGKDRQSNRRKKEEKPLRNKKYPNPFLSLSRFFRNDKVQKILGLFFLVLSFFLTVAFTSYLLTWKSDDNIFYNSLSRVLSDTSLVSENWMGKIGAVLSFIFIKKWFGVASYLFILMLFISGMNLFLNIKLLPQGKTIRYSVFAILWLSLCFAYFFKTSDLLILGGTLGYQGNLWFDSIIGRTGTALMLVFALSCFLIIEYNIHLRWARKKPEEIISEDIDTVNPDISNELIIPADTGSVEDVDTSEPELISNELKDITSNDSLDITELGDIKETEYEDNSVPFIVNNPDAGTPDETGNEQFSDQNREHFGLDTEYNPTLELSSYQFPSIDLLEEYDTGDISVQNEELAANKNRIIKTLNNYGINIDRINATIGPTVTLYEIIPAPGVRINKIKNLEDDIALSLSALGIRIIAPMPGKGTIGIEVPNQNAKVVSMKSMLASEEFRQSKADLPLALGKTISNKPYIADLAKMPHLLMAGATGQGKSVGLNAIITSLLYKKHPSELKFVLVDPKKVELTLYSQIERHYLAKLPDCDEAIINNTRKVVRTLNALCMEMDERYDLLKSAGVRNLKEYNLKFTSRKLLPTEGHKFLPYIILIVDEFADLIMTAGKEVELPITRLAQLARAVGIHLIVATQRPSVNIITGTIKANFPARMAFRVTAKVDSRTILDTGGADQLIGRGDMLLATGSEVIRLQCPFVDTPEVERITDFIGAQRGFTEAFLLPDCPDEETESGKVLDPNERDPLFDEAAHIIVSHQQGSTSLLQRKLKLGYNRAGRIIDQLESAGIVGPFEGSKAREVRIKDLLSLEQFLKKPDVNHIY